MKYSTSYSTTSAYITAYAVPLPTTITGIQRRQLCKYHDTKDSHHFTDVTLSLNRFKDAVNNLYHISMLLSQHNVRIYMIKHLSKTYTVTTDLSK